MLIALNAGAPRRLPLGVVSLHDTNRERFRNLLLIGSSPITRSWSARGFAVCGMPHRGRSSAPASPRIFGG